ncbi:MAG: 2-phosphosulfolactate phosphatase [Planctomycetaceae bacterium]|nr:2-phosphosulfolactate phosphatase [Planctomycetaceae bacterium]
MEETRLAGSVVVIIDILRASTTIITAIYNGAACVIPCATPEAARQIRTESALSGVAVLLGGERGGVLIDGFDYGNSPAEYSADRITGRTIAFTTTNGTRALLKSADAETILIGAFINRHSLVNRLRKDSRPIHLVCAGTDGAITGEDVLFAGSVVDALVQREETNTTGDTLREPNDCARIAQAFWRSCVGDCTTGGSRETLAARIEAAMRDTQGGFNLRRLGFDLDIRRCSAVDTVDCVPVLNREQGTLS